MKSRKPIKIRKSWGKVRPVQEPHSTKHGKKGYTRQDEDAVIEEQLQDVDKLQHIIVDLEATCWQGHVPKEKMEIIEVGAVRLAGDKQTVADEFDRFVQPIHRPKLSNFCKELTGITQEQVDAAEPFNIVFPEFLNWIGSGKYAICSWGNYDLRQFETDAKRHGLHLPHEFRANHINLKERFACQRNIKPCGMARALKILGIPLEGTHHRGIDDARNIAKIATASELLPET